MADSFALRNPMLLNAQNETIPLQGCNLYIELYTAI